MSARSPHEPHRVATPLELLFDLVFVGAVAQAAGGLDHAIVSGHALEGLGGYAMVFFAIWWAWMNFTWFASAYDNDDALYRVLVFVQMAGVLLLAAGVPRAFEHRDFDVVLAGYLVMRAALATLWLRAAHHDSSRRGTDRRYAAGVSLCMIGWAAVGIIGWPVWAFVLMGAVELVVPMWAEAVEPTTWHPEHIAERYGLFTLIVLGECVLAATTAVEGAVSESGLSWPLVLTAVGALLLVFGTWWSYFKTPVGELLRESRNLAFLWGYGHYFVFAAIAALGAGLSLAAESAQHTAHVPDVVAALAVAVPVVVYLVTLLLVDGPLYRSAPLPVASVVVACVGMFAAVGVAHVQGTPVGILLMGLIMSGMLAFHMLRVYRASSD